jgi:hypothetical protein
MNVPFALFEPDKSPFGPATPWILNCLPVADGWGSCPRLKEISDALPAECRGAFACQREDGSWQIFAGTATKLYRLDQTDNTWDDVTRSSGGDYAVPANHQWVFRKFGPYVVCVNGQDAMQKFNIESDTNFSAVGGSPPIASGIEVVGDFLVAFNISGEPGRLRWCEINDIEGWTVGENLADYNDIPDLNAIQAIVPTAAGAVVCCELGFMSMNAALSTQWVFTFALVTKARGVAARYAVVPIGPGDFVYYSYDGFYRGETPIGGERVDRWFSAFSDSSDIINMAGEIDPFRKIVWFRFKAKDSAYYLLGYNYQLDRWCLSDNQITAMMKVGSPVITNDAMDNYFDTIDDIDVPYDSTFWAGGRPSFGGITPAGTLAYQSGANAAATLETAMLRLGEGTRRVNVNGARAKTDATNFTARISVADYDGQPLTDKPAVTPSTRTRFIPYRADGRVHKFGLDIPEDEAWTFASGLEVQVAAGGMS